MARERNKGEYLATAEAAIDNGWKGLSIFRAERSAALLHLATATDDRIRMTVVGGLLVGVGLSNFGEPEDTSAAQPVLFE